MKASGSLRRQRPGLFALGVLFGLNVLAWLAVFNLSQSRLLEVTFFDVGQGDAIFIVSPAKHQILIDGGPGSVILEKLTKEMPFWDRTIDLIILTHPERDHLAGLLEVLKRYKVENILWTGAVRDTAEYKEWQNLIQEEKAKISLTPDVKRLTTSGVVLEILYPFESQESKVFKDSNNTSIVAKLNFGKNSFLFMGDAYRSVEKKLVDKETDLASEVLKVGHHGSKASTSEEFIQSVKPKIAVIPVGKNNNYGHPHQEVLEILNKYGIKIFRTDKDGDIKIFSDGNKIISVNQL